MIRGFGFFFPHEVYSEWILLHQVQKDISLGRFPQMFVKNILKLSVICGRVDLGNPNDVQVLIDGAELACIRAHML